MAVRVVYILPDKGTDIIQKAVGWTFNDSTLKIWGKDNAKGPMIEIRRDVVFSIEHITLENDAKKAPVGAEKAPEEPEKAPEKPKRARKRS